MKNEERISQAHLTIIQAGILHIEGNKPGGKHTLDVKSVLKVIEWRKAI